MSRERLRLVRKSMVTFSFVGLLMMSASTPASNLLVFPQVVAGGGYVSFITLLNFNYGTSITGTLTVYNPDGSPRSIAIDGQPTGSQFTVTIPAGGSVVLSTTAGGNLSVGMAKFVSDFPAGGVVRFQFSGGQVGVLASPRLSYATLPVTTNNGNDTGLAITNSGTAGVNVRLIYTDAGGNPVQTVDPPELNPLPPNGQVAKFAAQFGLTQAANQAGGTIQIKSMTPGGSFHALTLLLNAGLLSTTAVVNGAVTTNPIELWHGSYTGTWNNTTFGSTGSLALTVGVVQATQSVFLRVTLGGAVFGGTAPPPTIFFANYTSTGISTTGSDPALGNYSLTVGTDGSFNFTSTVIPSPNVSGVTATGTLRDDKIVGNYTVTLKPSGSASGTFEIDHTNQ